MCLVFIAYQSDPRWPLIIAANRDEMHGRPSRAAGFWPEQPAWLGGKDLEAGGSWMALSLEGRLAVVTNVREPGQAIGIRSRGELVTGFLADSRPAASVAESLAFHDYTGFNLLAAQRVAGSWQLHWATNRPAPFHGPVTQGIHGLSNAQLNTPWPKVATGRQALDDLLAQNPGEAALIEGLWRLLADRRQAPSQNLPETGVAPEVEALLSSRFIVSPTYGTRASTLLLADTEGRVRLLERRFNHSGDKVGEQAFAACLD